MCIVAEGYNLYDLNCVGFQSVNINVSCAFEQWGKGLGSGQDGRVEKRCAASSCE